MGSSFTLGKIRGIDIGINYTLLIAIGLITWSLAVGFFPIQFPGWSTATYWIVSIVSSLLLFGSVLAHELMHSLVAQGLGLRVQSISLFIFGGVSNIVGEPTKARDELYISIVGPLTSFGLAVIFGVAFAAARGGNEQVMAVLFYMATVNLLLAIFNLIPGFPLDGGRVFRAIVWWVTGSYRQATRVAVGLGKGIAYLFIFGGLFLAFTGSFLSGIWLAFIGWFLSEAASSSYQQMTVQESLRGVHVRDLMTEQPVTVGLHTPLSEVVHDYILRRNVRSLPVIEENGELVGLVTLAEIRSVPVERWPEVAVAQVMTPLDQLHTVTPQDDASRALRAMGEEDVNQLPVIENGHLVGLLSRGNLIRFLQLREELGGRA